MTTPTQSLVWPTKVDYDEAIRNWKQTVLDPTVRSGTLSQDNMGIHYFGGANLYVAVYKIGNWMIRCFCSNPPRQPPHDIVQRYKEISNFCALYNREVSALLPPTFVEQGIRVQSQVFPIVKMPFLTHCLSLGDFIAEHYRERSTMEKLSSAWMQMINEMEANSIAHGDLDLTNVLVEPYPWGIALRLIDYDNVWIPTLKGYPQTEYGHAPFQHPHFLPPNQRPYDALMDRFSALVIYISLRALSSNPELYDEWGADESERLLFSENDYKTANLVDGRIAQLFSKVTDIELRAYIDALARSLRTNCMPPALGYIAQMTTHIALVTTRPTLPKSPPMQPPPVALWGQQVYAVGQNPWNNSTMFLQPSPNGHRGPDDPASMYGWAVPASANGPLSAPSPLYANPVAGNGPVSAPGSFSANPFNGALQKGADITAKTSLSPTQDHKPVHSKRRIVISAVVAVAAIIIILLLFIFLLVFFVLRPMGITL